MTQKQLKGLYWESFRQEARQMFSDLHVITLSKGGKGVKDSVKQLEMQAFPFDPELEGEFGKADFAKLRAAFGGRIAKDG